MAWHEPTFVFDEAAFQELYGAKLKEAMEDAIDEVLKVAKQHIAETVKGAGPGKPKWRNELDDNYHRIKNELSGYVAEGLVGPDYTEINKIVRGMIINEGSGSAVGNPPIHAGPEGLPVWDEDVTGQDGSKSKTEYDLPEEFNQVGNKFVKTTINECYDKVKSLLYGAINRLSMSQIESCFHQR